MNVPLFNVQTLLNAKLSMLMTDGNESKMIHEARCGQSRLEMTC